MANISYIRFLRAIESFANEHLQVKKFSSDFPGQMPNFATKDEEYPILFVSPTNTIFDMNITTFVVDVYCFDIIQKDRSNINTILSDTNLILSDLNRWILDADPAGFDIVTTKPTAIPIDNALLDYCAGWKMTLTVDTETYGVCEIPFNEIPIITTEVNNIVYTSYLTCDTLNQCDTFTNAIDNLQSQIDNIPAPDLENVLTTGNIADRDILLVDDLHNITIQNNIVRDSVTIKDLDNNIEGSISLKDFHLQDTKNMFNLSLENGIRFSYSGNGAITTLLNSYSGNDITLQVPDKAPGEYTIATIDDIVGGSETLDQVLANGNTTSNQATFTNGVNSTLITTDQVRLDNNTNGYYSTITPGLFSVGIGSKFIQTDPNQITFRMPDPYGTQLLIGNPSQSSVYTPTFKLPSKLYGGPFTLATQDYFDLQKVTDNGSQTSNNIQINPGLTQSGSKALFLNNSYIQLLSLNEGQLIINWNSIKFPSSNNMSQPTIFGATGSSGATFWLPAYKPAYSTPFILVTQEDTYIPFSGNSNNLNIFKNIVGTTFSTATFYVRGLTSSNGSVSISSTGSNTNSNWAWDIKTINGVPTGGSTGQILAKNSTTNYDTIWIDNYTEQVKTTIKADEAILKGQPVYVSGANGTNILVKKASNLTEATSSKTLGLMAQDLTLNGTGFIITDGLLGGLDTSGATAGDAVWLGATAGTLIYGLANKPSAPNHLVYLGVVTRASATQGEIWVKPQNGFELEELHNVKITSVSNSDIIQYNSTNSLWENKNITNYIQRLAFLKI